MKKFKSILNVLFFLPIIFIIVVMSMVLSPEINDFMNRTKFDQTEWINWEENEGTQMTRWNMTHDLTTNYNLIGMTIQESKNLLGLPSSESNNEFRYFLGMTGHGINTGTLTLKFKEGKIVSFEIYQG